MATRTGSERELIARWIRPERSYPADPDAHITDSGIPVWALVGHWLMTGQDPVVTASDYHLEIAAVQAALAYYKFHRELIDARLAANVAVTG